MTIERNMKSLGRKWWLQPSSPMFSSISLWILAWILGSLAIRRHIQCRATAVVSVPADRKKECCEYPTKYKSIFMFSWQPRKTENGVLIFCGWDSIFAISSPIEICVDDLRFQWQFTMLTQTTSRGQNRNVTWRFKFLNDSCRTNLSVHKVLHF